MIRQTDDVRTSSRCKSSTRYLTSSGYFKEFNNCVYFKNDKCTLNCCVRKEYGNGFTQTR